MGDPRQHQRARLLTDQSNYDRTVLYDTFDVTAFFRDGRENVVAPNSTVAGAG
ncbi:hypothetical protein [Streptomyces sp. NPDC058335]|uniref:hypothetical protein n=1 Tax=Streptomyces sp. NPDC058335 TaxID=3346451 RepID=UPI0036667972